MCALAGCKVAHFHPITGAPPDYHFILPGGEKAPRWWNPYKGAPDPKDWWYSPQELAKVAGCSDSTITAACKRGDLPHGRISPGGPRRIKLRDFEAWYRAQARIAA